MCAIPGINDPGSCVAAGIALAIACPSLLFFLWALLWPERSDSSQNSIPAQIVYGRKALLFGKHSVASIKRERWLNENLPVSSREEQTVLSRVLDSGPTQQVGRKDSREKEESVTGQFQESYRTAYPMGYRSTPIPKQTPTETPSHILSVRRWVDEQQSHIDKLYAEHKIDRYQVEQYRMHLLERAEWMLKCGYSSCMLRRGKLGGY